MVRPEPRAWIERLELQPHPEGGWFRETYRASEQVGGRALATSIYYLLDGDDFSALHRLGADELWLHHAGGALTLHLIDPEGRYHTLEVSPARPQALVPGGTWFGATLADPGTFALVGCVVVPGFEARDFEMAERATLLARYPEHREVIERLTR